MSRKFCLILTKKQSAGSYKLQSSFYIYFGALRTQTKLRKPDTPQEKINTVAKPPTTDNGNCFFYNPRHCLAIIPFITIHMAFKNCSFGFVVSTTR